MKTRPVVAVRKLIGIEEKVAPCRHRLREERTIIDHIKAEMTIHHPEIETTMNLEEGINLMSEIVQESAEEAKREFQIITKRMQGIIHPTQRTIRLTIESTMKDTEVDRMRSTERDIHRQIRVAKGSDLRKSLVKSRVKVRVRSRNHQIDIIRTMRRNTRKSIKEVNTIVIDLKLRITLLLNC